MAAFQFYMPTVNYMGYGCLQDAVKDIASRDFKKALLVTDQGLLSTGLVDKVTTLFSQHGLQTVVYDKTRPNPNITNVKEGLQLLKDNQCDFVISLGGGSPHDCAKGIALVATNGGEIKDYEGLNKSAKPQLPLVSINTTAGTASEITRFSIITNETTHIKMAIVDKHTTPIISVNDSELMMGMPTALTAATGMDALTHAVEAYVSTIATPVTDACALKAIELISQHLRNAVADGQNKEAREGMAYAQLLAGMAFNNASLGYVHAMAHQLGGFYDLPHGVCNAVLLPHVQVYNSQVCPERLKDVAKAMGCDIHDLDASDAAAAAIMAMKKLAADVNIPAGLTALGVKQEDLAILADNALKDACGLTNPKQATHEEIVDIFKAAM
ncbi:L-threonine dehydrogenase [Zooshikella ganghwensis]|uniref:L-threonine dehydrogenase n=1 Tax=Zooshikella ganghwensis TaxID=202772 RepID=UPI00041868B1|nr:L-threonine dehydrogenase [Zooshikella ganghwensis]